jgi:copper(I)-binding protein
MAAGYLRIGNHSGSDIRITRVSSPEYGAVEMHETVVEDGIARMRAIPVLEIANGETVVFERGGKHLMLMQPVGEPRTITLNFYSGDVLLLSVSADFTPAME